jgi:hypothetical protein
VPPTAQSYTTWVETALPASASAGTGASVEGSGKTGGGTDDDGSVLVISGAGGRGSGGQAVLLLLLAAWLCMACL